jgi:ATP-dependent helicase/nuclease subunit B
MEHAVPAIGLLAAAATVIADEARASLPDLGKLIILIPDQHAAGDMARALQTAAGTPTMLLPRITTLALWAAEVPLSQPVMTRAAREALLYRALDERGWLDHADRWAVASELSGLFDELTRRNIALPATQPEFLSQLERAYRARSGRPLQFEARLVHELWHALAGAGGEIDGETAYQLRLAHLAENAATPLYCVGLARLDPAERLFIERYAARAPVRSWIADRAEPTDPFARALALAWPRGEHADLRARAGSLLAASPASAVSPRLRLFAAASAEQEAQAVDVTVREWLLAGHRRIAVVVQDRVSARRARALLERAQVLVRDEAGWPFSTTSAATAIGRWLDLASNDCYYRDLLDLMKSPFAFHDWAREARQAAVWRLERYVREASVVARLPSFIALADENQDPEVKQMLSRVQRAQGMLGRGTRPIARWLEALDASLAEIGVRDGLAADLAGDQLLVLLERLREELGQDTLKVGFAEWRRWLARALESETFRDYAIDSPVVFTHLAATRLRAFDAVLVLGVDAAHLPGLDSVAMFFNQNVRAELGLQTYAQTVADTEDQLAAVLSSAGAAVATWQARAGGEEVLLSPQFERLRALHELAYRDNLEDRRLAALLPLAKVHSAAAPLAVDLTRRPAPQAPAGLIPRKISASGYNALVACPYLYHARYVLGLGELDDVQEMIEKADYGIAVHAILAEFHRAHPRVLDLDAAAAARDLAGRSEKAFAGAVTQNYLASAWLARWQALIPLYIDWQQAREKAGWHWEAGEAWREREIETARSGNIILRGRIDRIDTRADGATAVIDYKTQRYDTLRRKLEAAGEDVQLPVYALLWGRPVAEAVFLSIERDGIREAALKEEVVELSEAVRARLAALFDAMHAGAPLPAQGVDSVCQYCEMHGLCRKDHWS